ncbi:hypothetical protein HZC32_00525 [Candidatus Woesearchaeota archaeon]|nr:hypothetical protein [Candidatus Woesearchaeota archaeon]
MKTLTTSVIGDVCFSADISSVGEVNWGNSGKSSITSTTVSGGKVSKNMNW